MNRKFVATISLILVLLTGGAPAQQSKLKDTTAPRFKIGQVWSYWPRTGEKNSSFTVVKVEKHPTLGNIIHISLRGVKIRKPNGELISAVGHVPLSETAIESSGPRLISENAALPPYEQGYRSWKESFDAGRGGVYSVSIAAAVEEMEASLNRPAGGVAVAPPYQLLSRRRPLIYEAYQPATNTSEVTAMIGSDSEKPGTTLIFPEQPNATTPYQSGILLGSAQLNYEAGTRSARNAQFRFVAKSKDAFQDPPAFTINVAGQSIYEGNAELYLNIYEVNGRKFIDQWITLKVPVEILLRVAETTDTEFHIDSKVYKPAAFQQKYLRELIAVTKLKTN